MGGSGGAPEGAPHEAVIDDQSALAAAHHLLGESGTAVLLHVIETIADAPFEALKGFYERLEKKAYTRMKDLAVELGAEVFAVEQRVVYGKRVHEIVAHARDSKIDLIILHSDPLDPENPQAAWSSIGHQVAILAPCPVLLIK